MNDHGNKNRMRFAAIGVFIALLGLFVYLFSSRAPENLVKNSGEAFSGAFKEFFSVSSDTKKSVTMRLDDFSSDTSTQDAFQGANGGILSEDSKSAARDEALSPENSLSGEFAAGNGDAKSNARGGNNFFKSATPRGMSGKKTGAQKISAAPIAWCRMAGIEAPSRKIIFNEIAWMGSPSSIASDTKASAREWVELKNLSSQSVRLSGWQMTNASRGIKIVFGKDASIDADGFYLLARGSSSTADIDADYFYSGTLSNTGDKLFLFDDGCALADALDASTGWPAGDNGRKATLERDHDSAGWHTSVFPGGTPRHENSIPPVVILPAPTSAPTSTPTSTSMATLPMPLPTSSVSSSDDSSSYIVTVALFGDGIGIVSSSPPGILCGFACIQSYPWGTLLSFSPVPDPSSKFIDWSPPCKGLVICTFKLTGPASLSAIFGLIAPPASSSSPSPFLPPPLPPFPVPTSTYVANGINHPVIAEIQIGGASSTNDFVKIFNPSLNAIDVRGWKLRKKTSTGSDQSLRELPNGSSIAPGGYFAWANSANGFSETIGADVSSTASLAADNSVALLDASGTLIDAVAWGTGTNQYLEGAAFGTNPPAGAVLKRKFLNGVILDTDMNANDFTL